MPGSPSRSFLAIANLQCQWRRSKRRTTNPVSLDGYQVAQRIREALGSSDIFLVAITGYADARARQQALENGFDAHVAKPIDFSKLSSILAARVGAA